MGFPIYRPRRLRATENLRSMIRETELPLKTSFIRYSSSRAPV